LGDVALRYGIDRRQDRLLAIESVLRRHPGYALNSRVGHD
jgi:hypothetical protein